MCVCVPPAPTSFLPLTSNPQHPSTSLMHQVFKRMEQLELRQNALRVPGFLSTHPVFSDRIAKLQRKVSVCVYAYVYVRMCVLVDVFDGKGRIWYVRGLVNGMRWTHTHTHDTCPISVRAVLHTHTHIHAPSLSAQAEEVRPLYEDTRAGMFGYGNGGAGAAY